MTEYTISPHMGGPGELVGTAGPWYRIHGPYLPKTGVRLRLGYGLNGQLVCTGLVIDSPTGEISTTALRNVPVNKLISAVIDKYGLTGEDPAYMAIEDALAQQGGGFVIMDATKRVENDKPRRGGSAPTQTQLQRFAEAYRYALNNTDTRHKPIAEAARVLGISPATAHRWRATCYKKGLLDPPAK